VDRKLYWKPEDTGLSLLGVAFSFLLLILKRNCFLEHTVEFAMFTTIITP
jgi:hypothetical protein